MEEDNERMSKWAHLFKLSRPFSRYTSSKVEIYDEKFRQNLAIYSANIAIEEI